ncbi:MAG: ACT domain-containing protein [Actinomycetota bacterium]|nr:ACT domain-containing protein [Actinomycetota bacterium]
MDANGHANGAAVRTYAVTAVGPDAPGEVAALAEALAALGANLEDASMTRLRGHFAMTLVAAVAADPEAVRDALEAAGTGLHLSVFDVAADPLPEQAGIAHRLVVHGADRPGLLATVARAVARRGGNITDLTCRLAGGLYVITLELELPAADGLAEELSRAGLVASLVEVSEDVL